MAKFGKKADCSHLSEVLKVLIFISNSSDMAAFSFFAKKKKKRGLSIYLGMQNINENNHSSVSWVVGT